MIVSILAVALGATSIAVVATIGEDIFRTFLYGRPLRLYFRGESRLSNCCAERVLGEYDWAPLNEPPTGICRGCRDHAVFYTEDEFEELDMEENGYLYGS